jgi:hypothetical protein
VNVIRWLLDLLGLRRGDEPPPAESPETVADRIDRYADRCLNAGDRAGERDARVAAAQARRAANVGRALDVERDLYRAHGLRANGSPERPAVGTRGGTDYVRVGRQVRAGGSLPWRYNNPGYVRCSDRSASYGAIGCDGEYAIFPTEQAGVLGFTRALRDEHPDQPVERAVREQLPADRAESVLDRLRDVGVDVGSRVGELGESALRAVGDACRDAGGWVAGNVYDRGADETVPDWVNDVWGDSPPPATAEPAAGTDDS